MYGASESQVDESFPELLPVSVVWYFFLCPVKSHES